MSMCRMGTIGQTKNWYEEDKKCPHRCWKISLTVHFSREILWRAPMATIRQRRSNPIVAILENYSSCLTQCEKNRSGKLEESSIVHRLSQIWLHTIVKLVTLNSEVDGWSPNGQSCGWRRVAVAAALAERYEESLESRIHMIAPTNTILRSHVFGHLPETLSACRQTRSTGFSITTCPLWQHKPHVNHVSKM